jgi:hypothetical protein
MYFQLISNDNATAPKSKHVVHPAPKLYQEHFSFAEKKFSYRSQQKKKISITGLHPIPKQVRCIILLKRRTLIDYPPKFDKL